MGNGQISIRGTGTDPQSQTLEVGEVGMICTPNYQLPDDNGVMIPRADSGQFNADTSFNAGGRINGILFDITEEPFRKKEWQSDVNKDQPGSGL